MRRRCLDCGRYIPRGSRCDLCTEARRPAAARSTIPQAIKKRDGHRCVRCGVAEGQRDADGRPAKLNVHHLIPVRHGGSHDPANLVTLCVPCHREVEGQQKATFGQPAFSGTKPST